MRGVLSLLLCCWMLWSQAQPSMHVYNVIWHSPSDNAGASMPCGAGDIGMNVWVENGDVLIYVARSGNFDEHNTLMKSGRLRIQLSPNPFTGKSFTQQLHLQEGYVSVTGENNGVKATVNIWADVFRPVAHVDVKSNRKIAVTAAYESWRYQDRIVKARENFGNSWKWAAPKNNVYRADSIGFAANAVLFYHHNSSQTIFDTIVAQQGMQPVKAQLYNPLKQLAFGGMLTGKNFVPAGTDTGTYAHTNYKAWQLKSQSNATSFSLKLYLHNEQTASIADWKNNLIVLQQQSLQDKSARTKTLQWWKAFWQRSFICIDSLQQDSIAWQVGRNYQLFRYMLACNAKGQWPTKFNGGLLTVDPVFTDSKLALTPDFRNWGGGLHTAQNQRLVYYPMIKSGDWDMLQPQLNFYLRLQKNAELRTQFYWNHNGACFTEQMENFGLPNYAEYGTKRPADFDKGVEYNAWLEYEWDTVFEFCLMMLEEHRYTGRDIADRIPFIMSCLRFFDEHYQVLAKQRGSKALDADGKLVLYPGSAAETYKMATNSITTTVGMYHIALGYLQYFHNWLTTRHHPLEGKDSLTTYRFAQSNYVQELLQRIPFPSFQQFNGKTTLAPAKSWERINNTESPQLYPVFPWGSYGVGKPGLDTALNTWYLDTNVVKFRSHVGWKQDNIWAARLGLTSDAWQLTSLKLRNSDRRFPAFWGPGFDWVPDHNWGGSGMIGLQEMLLQINGDQLLLFPAWPKEKDVHFKLHAPDNTTVEARLQAGNITDLHVWPASRKKDVIIMLQ
ncbi:MAG: hypothetical protein IT252_15990 [Chitinophagaceae bacterium]|nr:hypothetical protein [Chitinophagaceae bacterium]